MKRVKNTFRGADAYDIIRLCYILIIVSALYVLKINCCPSDIGEQLLALSHTPIMVDYIFHSTMVLIGGSALFMRLF